MDESKLTELLRDAVADAPPPTFDQHDVTAESARQVRRRNGIIRSSAIGVALLAGTTALSVALWTAGDSTVQSNAGDAATAGGNENAAPYELPNEGGGHAEDAERGDNQNSSPETRKQGRPSGEDAGPAGPGSTLRGCEQADRELAAALAGELPAAANVRSEDGLPIQYRCPAGATGVTFRLAEGTISAMLLPSAAVAGEVDTTLPGWTNVEADGLLRDGRVVLLISSSPAGTVEPYADRLDDWADQLALAY